MSNERNESDSKIEFRTESEGEVYVETLWANRIAGNTYKLDNSPFYAYNVSWEDIIEAEKEVGDGFPVFRKVVKKSGNKTVRILFDPPIAEGNSSAKLMQELTKFRCTYEGANPKFIALNVPSNVDLKAVEEILKNSGLEWEYADPSYSVLYPDKT